MKRKMRPVALICLCAVFLAGCTDETTGGTPPKPIPGNVPKGPDFETTDDLASALDRAKIPCPVLGRSPSGDATRCGAEFGNGEPVELELHVDTPSHLGTAIFSRRNPPYQHTLVAAGNWYIRVMDPDFAPRVAKALHAVVLKPLGETSAPDQPPYKDQLPEIPGKPTYKNLEVLADKVDAAVGCTGRDEGDNDPALSWKSLNCTTGRGGQQHQEHCADLAIYDDARSRDEGLWSKITGGQTPKGLVAGSNWSVALCDEALVDDVVKRVGGVEVR
ncbi:hypothetical protein ACQEV2_19980 [Streptomyces sp. CA-251387]|uniref:hypothetical protein n=1 Tax=Streptomyces sp. CA-251387 TaxID=3240064 RepID=UPI003D93D99E